VFGVIFITELPDKSQLASLALSTHFRKSPVWLGAAAAFLIHVCIAVAAGRLIAYLPHRPLEIIVGLLFLACASILAFAIEDIDNPRAKKKSKAPEWQYPSNFTKVFAISFMAVFLSEWGDITQIVTANYAAKIHDPLSVGIGAVAALWIVAALSVTVGSKLLHHVPAKTLHIIMVLALMASAIWSFVSAFK